MTAPAPSVPYVRLFTDKTAPPPARMCLDANGVFDVWEHELAMSGRRGKKAHSDLIGCLARMRSARCEVFVTPHVVEEFFHVTTQGIMTPLFKTHSVSGEKGLRRAAPAAHKQARMDGLKALDEAMASLGKHGVRMLLPVGEEPPAPSSLGQDAYDAFRLLLHTYVELGGKDAIHVALAGLLDCTAFASRDGDFHRLVDAVVYTEKLPTAPARVAAPAAPAAAPPLAASAPTTPAKPPAKPPKS